jgi:hypothetical protein
MENSPLHVCRLQPARSELMSALLDAGGAFGARKGGSIGRRFCFVLSPEVVHQRSLIFSIFKGFTRRETTTKGDIAFLPADAPTSSQKKPLTTEYPTAAPQ